MEFFLKKKLKSQNFFWFFLLFFYSLFCFSGCVPKKEWVFRCGPCSISSGEYDFLLMSALFEANSKIMGNKSDIDSMDFNLKKLRDSYIEGESAMIWVEKESQKRAKRWLLAQIEYDRMNLDKSREVDEKLKSVFSQDFDGEFAHLNDKINMSKYGCSKETFYNANLDGFKMSALITEYFGEGKSRYNRVDENAVKRFIEKNFIKFKSIKISKNINSAEYSKKNDSKVGSKLSEVEGVNSPQELVEKYMNELKDSSNIDEISKRYDKLIGAAEEKEKKPTVVYKLSDDKFPDQVDKELKKFVCEIEIDAAPVLKENENFYFIIQRYNLDEKDIKSQNKIASQMVSTKEIEIFLNEIEKKYANSIEVNEKILSKYSAEEMAKRIVKYKPKADKKKGFPF